MADDDLVPCGLYDFTDSDSSLSYVFIKDSIFPDKPEMKALSRYEVPKNLADAMEKIVDNMKQRKQDQNEVINTLGAVAEAFRETNHISQT